MPDLSDQSFELLGEQKRSWKLLRENLESLRVARTRTYEFEHRTDCEGTGAGGGSFIVQTQFNPSRMASVAAKVDVTSIRGRPCFLCAANRPAEQRELPCGDGFVLLCNPYPIFSEHFTIVHEQHRPQRILESFSVMLRLSKDLGARYEIFYNGPQCGASAPDHLHFQAGERGSMPIDSEYDRIKRPIAQRDKFALFAGDGFLRRFISIESDDLGSVERIFRRLYDALGALLPRVDEPEPMVNIIAWHDRGTFRVIVFPRIKHRPSFYFADDGGKMLLSPGTVDMGGLIVTPRRQDFERLTAAHLAQMYDEITMPAAAFAELSGALSA